MANGGRTARASPSAEVPSLHVGNVIEHQRFGKGTVVNIEDTVENLKATVKLEQNGTKQLLLKFAHFKVISYPKSL